MFTKMNGNHLFLVSMLLLVLIGMSLTVKGTPEQLTAASNTELRNFAEISPNTPELFKRVCGMHSFKCGRRRSSLIKVKKKTIVTSINILSSTSLPNYSDLYKANFDISYILKCTQGLGYSCMHTL